MERPNFFILSIQSLAKNSSWSYKSETMNNYYDIQWLSEDIPKPSKEELELEMKRLQDEWESKEYQRLRAPEYPKLTDLADALYWNSKGDSSYLDAYYSSCEEIKNKYPKTP